MIKKERSEQRDESQKGKERHNFFEEKQEEEQDINGEFDHTLLKENTDNKIEDGHLNKMPESMMFKSLYDLCKVIYKTRYLKNMLEVRQQRTKKALSKRNCLTNNNKALLVLKDFTSHN